jgi:hypothetical protein
VKDEPQVKGGQACPQETVRREKKCPALLPGFFSRLVIAILRR